MSLGFITNLPIGVMRITNSQEGAADLILALYFADKPLTQAQLKEIIKNDSVSLYRSTLKILIQWGIIKYAGWEPVHHYRTYELNYMYKDIIEERLDELKERSLCW